MNIRTKTHLQNAAFHLLRCWDELREAERLDGRDAPFDFLEEVAGSLAHPGDAFNLSEEDLEHIFVPE